MRAIQWWSKVTCRSCRHAVDRLLGASHGVLLKTSQNPQLPIKSKLLSLVFKFHHHQAQTCIFSELLLFNSHSNKYSKLSYSISLHMQFHIRKMSLPWHSHISKYLNSTHSLKAQFKNQLFLKALPPAV